jgi:hypothetical protein
MSQTGMWDEMKFDEMVQEQGCNSSPSLSELNQVSEWILTN